jgi:hypothetical protein
LNKGINFHGIESKDIPGLNPKLPTQIISPLRKIALTIPPKPCATQISVQPIPIFTSVISSQTILPDQSTVVHQKNLRGGNLIPLTAVPVVNQTQKSIILESNPLTLPITTVNKIQINGVQNSKLISLSNLNPQPISINTTPTQIVISSHRIVQPLRMPLISRI